MIKKATLSPCRQYRYDLLRVWEPENEQRVVFVMLNPSTADHEVDDATIRRCIGFGKRMGMGGLTVVNLFAYRTKSPKVMFTRQFQGTDTVGPDNRSYWARHCITASAHVICGWGAHPKARDQALSFMNWAEGANVPLYNLGPLNHNGAPKHPLYLPSDAEIKRLSGVAKLGASRAL